HGCTTRSGSFRSSVAIRARAESSSPASCWRSWSSRSSPASVASSSSPCRASSRTARSRSEMVRGVILSSSKPGIAAALILGLGRAIGEAIAVTQVIGSSFSPQVHGSLFGSGDTLASRIAEEFQGAVTKVQISSLFYLAAILLVIGLVTNLIAQIIVRRFEYERTGAE